MSERNAKRRRSGKHCCKRWRQGSRGIPDKRRLRIENKEFTRQRRGKDSNPRDPFEPNGFQAIKNRANRSPRWRRRGDSNPRDPFGPNGFQDRRFQPLTHSSVFYSMLKQLLAGTPLLGGCILVALSLVSIRTPRLHCRLQPLHRGNCVSVQALDVNLTSRVHAAVTEDRLNRLVVHPEAMQVGCETAAERMPPTPLLIACNENRFDVAAGEVSRSRALRFRASSKAPECYRHRCPAPLRLCGLDVPTPY